MLWNAGQQYCMRTFLHSVIKCKSTTEWLKQWRTLICTDRCGNTSKSGFRGETGEPPPPKKRVKMFTFKSQADISNIQIGQWQNACYVKLHSRTHTRKGAFTDTIVSLFATFGSVGKWAHLKPIRPPVLHVSNTLTRTPTHIIISMN